MDDIKTGVDNASEAIKSEALKSEAIKSEALEKEEAKPVVPQISDDGLAGNKKLIVGGAVVVLVLLLVIVTVMLTSKKKTGEEDGEQKEASAAIATMHAPEVPLEEDAIPEINELMERYYAASADGDIATLSTLQDYISDLERIRIEKKSNYIEGFDKISCYTKAGMADGSYLLYAYNEVKLKDIDTPAPALNTYVIYRNEGGEYYIHEGDLDENTLAYFQELSTQDNVTNLCNVVQDRYNEAVASDTSLDLFMKNFPTLIQDEVAKELAGSENGSDSQEAGTADDPQTPGVKVTEVEAIEKVNVRISDSQEAERLGQVEKGERVPLVEKKENGWSKVMFNNQEAFIKTEFLADVVTQTPAAQTSEASGAQTASQGGADQSSQTATARANTRVNVRASASETGEKLGTVDSGTTFELIEKGSDGWSKIKYEGRTAYVKSEFLD